jgi:DNA-binding NarL/FixJ family response regulator
MIRLLLVDDHASSREPLAMLLDEEADLTVAGRADTLAEARELLAGGLQVDVTVLDLGLPDGPGEDLIGPLLATNPRSAVLVLTSFSERDRLARAVGAGAAGVLHKASDVAAILDAIRRLHRGERLIAPDEAAAALRVTQTSGRGRQREAALLDSLTPREREILEVLAEGLSDKEIAARLTVSIATVRTHVNAILTKTGARSRTQALILAVRHGVVRIE